MESQAVFQAEIQAKNVPIELGPRGGWGRAGGSPGTRRSGWRSSGRYTPMPRYDMTDYTCAQT